MQLEDLSMKAATARKMTETGDGGEPKGSDDEEEAEEKIAEEVEEEEEEDDDDDDEEEEVVVERAAHLEQLSRALGT